jgi:mannose-6-phosphate isomerase-like protein (cupin superfamily)
MKVIKRNALDIPLEEAHGGSGSRKVYATSEHTTGDKLEAITHGYLSAGSVFDWHNHEKIDEAMIVLSGSGQVHDEDGIYGYQDGDVFVFPAGVQHKITNTSKSANEYIFVRVKE